MTYVYLLLRHDGKIYVGSSSNLKQRIKYHQAGKVPSTKPYRPVKLIYYEVYLEKTDALIRELYLKTGHGRQELKKQLKHSLHGLFV